MIYRLSGGAGLVLASLAGLLAAGCGGKPVVIKPPTPVATTVVLQAGEALNPDAAGRPSPVFLRIYALRDAAPLMTADFDALVAGDETLLDAVSLYRQVLTLRPGERRELEWQLDPAARAVAAVAEFRDPYTSTWRASVPLSGERMSKHKPLRVTLRVDSTQMQMNLGD